MYQTAEAKASTHHHGCLCPRYLLRSIEYEYQYECILYRENRVQSKCILTLDRPTAKAYSVVTSDVALVCVLTPRGSKPNVLTSDLALVCVLTPGGSNRMYSAILIQAQGLFSCAHFRCTHFLKCQHFQSNVREARKFDSTSI